MLIDSHCHLYMGSWKDNLPTILQNAKETGVGKIICPGIDIETSNKSAKIAFEYKEVYAAVGIHPHDAKDAPSNFIDKLIELLQQPKVIAVGEIGLDFYRNISDSEIQHEVFKKQLQLAKELDLPVIIHNRNADEEIIKILNEYKSVKGVAHCFSSDIMTAKSLLDMGLYISFAGNLTYKNSDLPEIAKEIPFDRLLVETDAPFLSPRPFRGKENEPSRVKFVVDKLAECRDVSKEIIEMVTHDNAVKLFSLPKY